MPNLVAKKTSFRRDVVLGLLFLFLALGWTCYGIATGYEEYVLRDRGVITTASAVSKEKRSSGKVSTAFWVDYAFSPPRSSEIVRPCRWLHTGAPITRAAWVNTTPGSQLDVIFDPLKPCRTRPIASPNLYHAAMLSCGAGLSMLLVAVMVLVKSKKPAQSSLEEGG